MRVLFMAVLAAVLTSGCATYGGLRGFEAAGVVAGNQALVSSLGLQAQQALYAMPGYGNIPVCRIQDLAGLPQVNQPVLVRVGKGKGHRMADIVAGAAIVGGTIYIATGGDAKLAGAGAAAGAGGGLLFSNHEQELCLFIPIRV